MIQTIVVPLTTDAAGDASDVTLQVNGFLYQVGYVPGAAPLDTLTDLTIAGNTTTLTYFTKADIGLSSFIDASIDGANGAIAVNEELTVTVAQGGNTKSGTFYLFIDAD